MFVMYYNYIFLKCSFSGKNVYVFVLVMIMKLWKINKYKEMLVEFLLISLFQWWDKFRGLIVLFEYINVIYYFF